MEITENLLSLINNGTAKAGDSLVYKQPQQTIIIQKGSNYLISYIKTLGKKENATKKQKVNPFENPDPNLVFYKNLTYTLLLNKFPITKNHFLLITNKFVRQESLLNPEDLRATYEILQILHNSGQQRPIAFYNSGTNSGASQSHRHVQFTFIDKYYKLFPDTVANSKGFFIPNHDNPPIQDKTRSFAHFIAPLNCSSISLDQFGMIYMSLIRDSLTVMKDHTDLNSAIEPTSLSYNLIMTKEWMMIIPRSSEIIHDNTTHYDFNINALGYIGLILVKNSEVYNELAKGDQSQIKISYDILLRGGYPLEYAKDNHESDY